MVAAQEQLRLIRRGVAEILPETELVKKLEKSVSSGKPLKVKLGLDPTAPDIHQSCLARARAAPRDPSYRPKTAPADRPPAHRPLGQARDPRLGDDRDAARHPRLRAHRPRRA